MNPLQIVALQPAVRWQQAMPNMHLIRQMVDKHVAAAGPASRPDLIVLPEVFNGINCDDDPLAAPVARRFLSTLARSAGAAVVGGIDIACDDGARRNGCFIVSADGAELGVYYKRILFGRERGSRMPGKTLGVFDLPLKARAAIRVGVLICGDMWDPRLVVELRDRIDILCVPAKTTVTETGRIDYARRLWWHLALIRAMENAVPIVVSDWAEGRHESVAMVEGTRVQSVHYTSGGASITDPGRRPNFDELQITLPRGQPGVLAAGIDLDAVAQFREYRRSVGLLPEN